MNLNKPLQSSINTDCTICTEVQHDALTCGRFVELLVTFLQALAYTSMTTDAVNKTENKLNSYNMVPI